MCMHFSERRFAEFTLFESEENGRRKSSVSLPHTCSPELKQLLTQHYPLRSVQARLL